MNFNPFASQAYETIWLKHFKNDEAPYNFKFIDNVRFVKKKALPVFYNIGKNFTNGMTYSISEIANDFKGKVFIVYDVPDYFPITNANSDNGLKVCKIKQYKGVYTDLSNFNTLDDVLLESFSSKSRSRFRGRVRQIESNFNISHKVYFGDISKEDYDREINALKNLIIARFEQREVHNTVIPMWEFYEELMYPLIQDKKVVFNIVYDAEKPIAMSLNFVYDDIVAIAIRSFDIEYYKYNIGNYEIYKLFDWCVANKMRVLDFSKGEIDYKSRWSNNSYDFNCHVLYDSKSIIAQPIAKTIITFYTLKQFLRDKGVNLLYTKAVFLKKKLLGK